MQVFDITEFTQDIPKVFNTALIDEVIINNNDGNRYKLLPIKTDMEGKSPLEDIPHNFSPRGFYKNTVPFCRPSARASRQRGLPPWASIVGMP